MKALDVLSVVAIGFGTICVVASSMVLLDGAGIPWRNAEWLQAMTGIVALIVSGFISFLGFKTQRDVSEKQSRSSVRQRMLSDFEKSVIDLVFFSTQQCALASGGQVGSQESHEATYKIFISAQKIGLFLNLEDKNHKEMARLVDAMNDFVTRVGESALKGDILDSKARKVHASELSKLRGELTRQARIVINNSLKDLVV